MVFYGKYHIFKHKFLCIKYSINLIFQKKYFLESSDLLQSGLVALCAWLLSCQQPFITIALGTYLFFPVLFPFPCIFFLFASFNFISMEHSHVGALWEWMYGIKVLRLCLVWKCLYFYSILFLLIACLDIEFSINFPSEICRHFSLASMLPVSSVAADKNLKHFNSYSFLADLSLSLCLLNLLCPQYSVTVSWWCAVIQVCLHLLHWGIQWVFQPENMFLEFGKIFWIILLIIFPSLLSFPFLEYCFYIYIH